MASRPAPFASDPRSAAAPLIIAIAAGAAAAGIVLFLTGSIMVAAGFLAAALAIAGIAYLLVRLWPVAKEEEPVVDWSVAHTLASMSNDALAVTDRAGRLVCANERFGTLFPTYPAPPGVVPGEWVSAQLGTAGRTAWRDGQASSGAFDAAGTKLTAHITRVGDSMLVWRFAGTDVVDLAKQAQALVAGSSGDRLGSAGIMMALLGADGRVRAANRVTRQRAMGDENAMIEGRDFTRFLITDNLGIVRFEREGLSGTPLRVLEIPFLDGDNAPMLVALLDDELAIPQPAIGDTAGAHVRSLISLLPSGIALVGSDGRFVHMNDAFVRAAHVNQANPPIYPGDLVVREDKAALADAIRRFASGAAHSADMTVRFAEAPDEGVAISIAAARGLGEAAVLLSLRDAGEEGRLKRQVAQATKMQAVGQLAGGVAHDFNNILTAIIGYASLAADMSAADPALASNIREIQASAERAAGLTGQLLAFSRKQVLQPRVLDLNAVVGGMESLLHRVLGEDIEITVAPQVDLWRTKADPTQIAQVLLNLAVNARDAMAGGGELRIQTVNVPVSAARPTELADKDFVMLGVSDTGVGMTEDVRMRVFEPFFTTKGTGGTGLGLATAYGIVAQSGGALVCESRPGEGATFRAYFPRTHEPLPSEAAAEPAGVEGGATERILLVEDDERVRRLAERVLRREGYRVLSLEPQEAVEVFDRGETVDLLLSDVVMPGLSGPDVAARLRAREPALRVLFVSGYADPLVTDPAKTGLFGPVLNKPFTPDQLLGAVRSALAS